MAAPNNFTFSFVHQKSFRKGIHHALLAPQPFRGILRPCEEYLGRSCTDSHSEEDASLCFDGAYATRGSRPLSGRGRSLRAFYSSRLDNWRQIKEGVTAQYLETLFDNYFHEALRLQKAYASQIEILIGVEVDWIRPSSRVYISKLLEKYPFELFVGSVHHVHTVPTDYDHILYAAARDTSGGSDERIFEDYFDLQYEMLKALKPPIVGHFDVIRLKADNPDGSIMHWQGVWHKISRNLDFIAQYGGILELNSAALRKGMSEPYPKAEICRVKPLLCHPTLASLIACTGVPAKRRAVHAIR